MSKINMQWVSCQKCNSVIDDDKAVRYYNLEGTLVVVCPECWAKTAKKGGGE